MATINKDTHKQNMKSYVNENAHIFDQEVYSYSQLKAGMYYTDSTGTLRRVPEYIVPTEDKLGIAVTFEYPNGEQVPDRKIHDLLETNRMDSKTGTLMPVGHIDENLEVRDSENAHTGIKVRVEKVKEFIHQTERNDFAPGPDSCSPPAESIPNAAKHERGKQSTPEPGPNIMPGPEILYTKRKTPEIGREEPRNNMEAEY